MHIASTHHMLLLLSRALVLTLNHQGQGPGPSSSPRLSRCCPSNLVAFPLVIHSAEAWQAFRSLLFEWQPTQMLVYACRVVSWIKILFLWSWLTWRGPDSTCAPLSRLSETPWSCTLGGTGRTLSRRSLIRGSESSISVKKLSRVPYAVAE